MTRQEALNYDNEIKEKLMQEAVKLGLEEKTGSSIVDNYIMVIPDDARKSMIFLGNETVSYKLGNIRMDLKKAIAAGLELAASVNSPESIFNYLQLLIVGAFFIQRSTKKEIERKKAYIIYYLHMRNCYEIEINEEFFMNNFKKWYEEQTGKVYELEDIKSAIDNLFEQKVIAIVDGNIKLKEYVIGNIK